MNAALGAARAIVARHESTVTELWGRFVESRVPTLLGTGFAIGLGVILVLSLYPGKPSTWEDELEDMKSGKMKGFYTKEQFEEAAEGNAPEEEDEPERLKEARRELRKATEEEAKLTKEKKAELIEKEFEKAKALRTKFGISEQEWEKAKQDAIAGKRPKESAWPLSLSATLDLIVYLCLFSGLIWALRTDYGIDVFEHLGDLFPREAETFKKAQASARELSSDA